MNKTLISLALVLAGQASAQHHAPTPGADSNHARSAYAGEESRDIKALSAQEQRAWADGQGGGMARAAELNGHPGPMHVLEHAQQLQLSAKQQAETRALMDRHKDHVRSLGVESIEAERQLDQLFRTRRATAAAVADLTQQIGKLHAHIRASHLITHLEQTAMLRPEQIAAYDRLRGYRR
jgi:hypothetical protein